MATNAGGYPYPLPTAPVANGANDIKALADALIPRTPAQGAKTQEKAGQGGNITASIVEIPNIRITVPTGNFLVLAFGQVSWNTAAAPIINISLVATAGIWKTINISGGIAGNSPYIIAGVWNGPAGALWVQTNYSGSPGAGSITQGNASLIAVPVVAP